MTNTTHTFIPGLTLSRKLYADWVAPFIHSQWPNLNYSAALIGDGSEVLGFDTPRSTDHDWGPRVYLFLEPKDFAVAKPIITGLETHLPTTLWGSAVAFADGDRSKGFSETQQTCGSPLHGVEAFTLSSFFRSYLAIDIHQPLTALDWLTLPEARLLSVTSGAVFHDDLGLQKLRERLSYYPHEVWLHLMACQWVRIAQEEAFFGRCAEVGDQLGAQILLARPLKELMRLCFLQSQQYAKWFGSAFARLDSGAALNSLFLKALRESSYAAQEQALGHIYRHVAVQHNALQLTEALPIEPSTYHDRPYQVIHGALFARALKHQIQDPLLSRLKLDIGGVNQFIDSTDILTRPYYCRDLQRILQ